MKILWSTNVEKKIQFVTLIIFFLFTLHLSILLICIFFLFDKILKCLSVIYLEVFVVVLEKEELESKIR